MLLKKKPTMILFVLVGMVLFLGGWSQGQATIGDIQAMKASGYSEDQIVKEVKAAGGFVKPPDPYKELKKLGISGECIAQLLSLDPEPQFPALPPEIQQSYRPAKSGGEEVYALAIGVNRYVDEKHLRELTCAVEDAENFARHLLALGVPARHIALLTKTEVTRQKIESVVLELCKGKGTLYIFYSGHGLYLKSSGFYFTCQDTDLSHLETTAYPLNELKRSLDEMKGERAIILIDACQSEGKAGRYDDEGDEIAMAGQLEKEAQERLKDLRATNKAIAILTSCGEKQKSWEGNKSGLFSQSLLTGLAGKADGDQNGWVDFQEMYLYVHTELVRRTNFGQTPDYGLSPSWKTTPDRGLPCPQVETDSLVKVEIEPPIGRCKAGERIRFRLFGVSQSGKRQEVQAEWKAKYGQIDAQGWYTPPAEKERDVIQGQDLPQRRHKTTAQIGIEREDALVKVEIAPAQARCKVGERVQFQLWGLTQSGKSRVLEAKWKAKYGEIDARGEYTAPANRSQDEIEGRELPGLQYRAIAPIVIEPKERQVVRVSADQRFQVLAEGVIRDTKTGLEWYVGPDVDTTWDEARDWVASLTVAGEGWRMPTIEELRGIYESQKRTEQHEGVHLDPVFKTGGWWVWSGELVGMDGNSPSARYFGFSYGNDNWFDRGFDNNTRGFAVRSGR